MSYDSTIRYRVHEQSVGWHPWVNEKTTVGRKGKRIEAIEIIPINFPNDASLEYRVHLQGMSWQPWVKAGTIAGTVGQRRRMEAIEIKLTNFYGRSICYWVHVGDRDGATFQDPGGPSQNCDGGAAGTTGRRRPIEQISIWLTP